MAAFFIFEGFAVRRVESERSENPPDRSQGSHSLRIAPGYINGELFREITLAIFLVNHNDPPYAFSYNSCIKSEHKFVHTMI